MKNLLTKLLEYGRIPVFPHHSNCVPFYFYSAGKLLYMVPVEFMVSSMPMRRITFANRSEEEIKNVHNFPQTKPWSSRYCCSMPVGHLDFEIYLQTSGQPPFTGRHPLSPPRRLLTINKWTVRVTRNNEQVAFPGNPASLQAKWVEANQCIWHTAIYSI